jgi:hypothetical protein
MANAPCPGGGELVSRDRGPAKVEFCRRLGPDWKELADFYGVSPHQRAAFGDGADAARNLWEWIERRGRFGEIHPALIAIDRDDLRELFRHRPRGGSPAGRGERSYDAFSTSGFDLKAIKRELDRGLARTGSGPLAFSLPYGDGLVLSRLCDWLADRPGGPEPKHPLSLSPDIMSQHDARQALLAYRHEELRTVDLVCPVHAGGVPARLVNEFWAGIREEIGPIDHRLIVIFTISGNEPLAGDIRPLPMPAITRSDIRDWVDRLVKEVPGATDVPLPAVFTDARTDQIEAAATTTNGLSPRIVFQRLEGLSRDLHSDPHQFADHPNQKD